MLGRLGFAQPSPQLTTPACSQVPFTLQTRGPPESPCGVGWGSQCGCKTGQWGLGAGAPWELRSPRSMWTHAPGAAITEGWLGLAECPIPAACKGEERRCQSKQQEGDQETATLPSPGRAQRMESKPPCSQGLT